MNNNCNQCEDREQRRLQNRSINNPNGYTRRYGADHLKRMMLGDLADELVEAHHDGADDEELCDLIDRKFLFGAWARELEDCDPYLLRNLRGLIVNLLRRSHV
jgi:hypothetical protein